MKYAQQMRTRHDAYLNELKNKRVHYDSLDEWRQGVGDKFASSLDSIRPFESWGCGELIYLCYYDSFNPGEPYLDAAWQTPRLCLIKDIDYKNFTLRVVAMDAGAKFDEWIPLNHFELFYDKKYEPPKEPGA